eukprot:m.300279 g.300279  ORF g.300279 m.300279 type:complete len:57 (+) comp40792_c0_seq3:2637-2807(+)
MLARMLRYLETKLLRNFQDSKTEKANVSLNKTEEYQNINLLLLYMPIDTFKRKLMA